MKKILIVLALAVSALSASYVISAASGQPQAMACPTFPNC
jgi:hypothetical protein